MCRKGGRYWPWRCAGWRVVAYFAAIAVGVIAFFLLLPVNVRRLHDRDMPGWWLLAFWLGSMLPFLGILVGIAQFVIMGCLAGTPGPNRYGADPKDGRG